MYIFRIYGERNSGTNFLEQLFIKNNFTIDKTMTKEDYIKNDNKYIWKHDIPCKKDKNIVDIFIFRNLEEWLVSMFNNSYHLERKDNFEDFLIKPQIIETGKNAVINPKTNNYINISDKDKTIFEIRYYKYNEIIKYKNNNQNVIFVNLTYLQNNTYSFLNYLNLRFMINNKQLITHIPHTKDSNYIEKNRKYDININDYMSIINKYKDENIENMINKLKFFSK